MATMANLLDVVAAHRAALHDLVDSQHALLQQALASADPTLVVRAEANEGDPHGTIGKDLLGGQSLKVAASQQSLQPTLPEDIDPSPPDVPKLPGESAATDQSRVSNDMSSLMPSDLKSGEDVGIQIDPNAVTNSVAEANRMCNSTATVANKAFSVDDTKKILYRLDCVAGICVLVNSIFMAVELEFEGRINGEELHQTVANRVVDPDWFFSIVDNVFAVLYFLELMCRIYVERGKFCWTAVNWLDIILAVITCMDVWILRPMALSGGATDQMILLRFMRAVKSMRAIRMVRTLRLFRGLRVLVQACYSFLPSLCWSMVLLAIFMVMGALMLGNLLQEFIADPTQDMDQREWIWQHYGILAVWCREGGSLRFSWFPGTALRSMYTLYEITFAGNWPTYARPVIDGVSSYFALFFLLYITLIVFAVIRVITAIFLKDTLDAANNDAEHLVVERLQKKAQYVKKLEAIFRAIDETGDGMITKERMSDILKEPEVKAYFQTLEVDVHEGAALFHILDNGDGEVTLDEFIDGILRCKGPARAIDQVAMQADLVHLHNKLSQILRILEEAHQTPRKKSKPALMRRGSVAEHLRLFRMDPNSAAPLVGDEVSRVMSIRG